MESFDASKEQLENYFGKADIVVLAETFHGTHDKTIISFLKKYLPILSGVFVEIPVNYQSSVDLYMETGTVDENLNGHFEGAEREGKNTRGLLKIFNTVKASGKKIICIDSSKIQTSEYAKKSKLGYYFLRGNSRDEDMFNNINDYYNHNQGKYAVIAGERHIVKGKHFRSGEDTLGTRLNSAFLGKYISVVMGSTETITDEERKDHDHVIINDTRDE